MTQPPNMADNLEDGLRGFMKAKRMKLHDQLDNIGEQTSTIFTGVTIYVNGYTEPDADTLKELVYTHGGDYSYAPSSRVTHVIATNLPTAKIKQLSETSKVCIPQWIVHCVQTNSLLPIGDYELYNISNKGQTKLGFTSTGVLNRKPFENLEGTSTSVQDSPLKVRDFVSDFYSHSRLHYLSTWSEELREFINKTLARANRKVCLLPSGESLKRCGVRAICHVDVDCFFVSVSLRDSPHLIGRPVAVTHAKNQSKEGIHLEDSTSDIASCSYEAREFGIYNGMSVGVAMQLCPDLVLVPYEFDKYRYVSQTLYEIIISYSHMVQAVSCDEAFIEFTDYARDFDEVCDIIKRLRHEVEVKTNCKVSAGISYNMLLARLATRNAKPDGQFYLAEEQVKEYLAVKLVSDLPGIGRSMKSQLDAIGVSTCGELLAISLAKLKDEFGTKTGEMLYYYSRGIDNRDLCTKRERKSLSVEINYGIRFSHISEADSLLQQLAQELHTRAVDASVEGTSICLKIKVRKATAPVETKKYLGHGSCDNISRTSQILIATNRAEEIARIACHLLKQLLLDPADIRGMGIQLNRLVPISKGSPSKGKMNDIRTLIANSPIKKCPHKATVKETAREEEEDILRHWSPRKGPHSLLDLPPVSELDQSVLLALPSDIQEEVFERYIKLNTDSSSDVTSKTEQPHVTQSVSLSSLISSNRDEFISEIRANVKAWIQQYPTGPSASDVEQFVQFLFRLIAVNLELTDLTLKCLQRTVSCCGCSKWKEMYANIVSHVQNKVCLVYGANLEISAIN